MNIINPISKTNSNYQRWSPREGPWPRRHILKSLAFTSKTKFLENCPVLGREQQYFLKRQNFAGKRQKRCRKFAETFFCFFLFLLLEIAQKFFLKTIFILFWRSYENFFQSFFSSILAPMFLVLGLEHSFPWPRDSLFSKSLSLAWPHTFLCPLP